MVGVTATYTQEAIRARMTHLGISQRQLALMLGKSRGWIYRVVRLGQELRLSDAVALADALSMPHGWLLEGQRLRTNTSDHILEGRQQVTTWPDNPKPTSPDPSPQPRPRLPRRVPGAAKRAIDHLDATTPHTDHAHHPTEDA